ncbi:hypothetical protein ACXIUH_19200 [Vibrio parahaemolyticus]
MAKITHNITEIRGDTIFSPTWFILLLPAYSNLTGNVLVTLEHAGTLDKYCRVTVDASKTTFASHRTGGLWS